MFFDGVAARLEELERLAGAGDREGVRRLAHELRGSSANLGLTALSASCTVLETAAGNAAADGESSSGRQKLERLADDVRAAERATRAAVVGAASGA
jgi:HPt (histidine-containing phosphotransfer) domain-containing protein